MGTWNMACSMVRRRSTRTSVPGGRYFHTTWLKTPSRALPVHFEAPHDLMREGPFALPTVTLLNYQRLRRLSNRSRLVRQSRAPNQASAPNQEKSTAEQRMLE